MPTAEEMDELWAAEHQLNGGPPPGAQHDIKMLEDPAYRAAYEAAAQQRATTGGRNVGYVCLDVNGNLHVIFHNEMKRPAFNEEGLMDYTMVYSGGVTTYKPVGE